MNIEVLLIPAQRPRLDSYDLIAVIDTLRASTVIVKALDVGAMGVYPVHSIPSARMVKKSIPSAVLGGERKSFRIPGFDLGNSPFEYTEESVGGRNVVITTTNGTRAVKMHEGYGEIVAMALSNFRAVAEYSGKLHNVLVVCAGSHGEVSLEDSYTAGRFISMFEMPALNDGAILARSISKEDPMKVMKTSHHGRYLSAKGMGEDLEEACVERNVIPILRKDPTGLAFFGRYGN